MQLHPLESNSLFSDQDCADHDLTTNFWQLWQEHQDYLYHRCCYWMGNSIDAEDALSQAMLKACDKAQTAKGVITNIKAWLTRLTYNVCIDIHRERNRDASHVESLEAIAVESEHEFVSQDENPVLAATQQELKIFFLGAINQLPSKLRETFILFFEEELSYPEIAQKLNISSANVRKRISQARSILRKQFNEYLGEDNQPHHQLNNSSDSPQQNGFNEKAAIANDHLTLSEQNQKPSLSPGESPNSVEPQNQKSSFSKFPVSPDLAQHHDFKEKEAIADNHLTLSEQNQKPLSDSPKPNRVNQLNQKPSIAVNFEPDRNRTYAETGFLNEKSRFHPQNQGQKPGFFGLVRKSCRKLLFEAIRKEVSIGFRDQILALLAKKAGFLGLNPFNRKINSS